LSAAEWAAFSPRFQPDVVEAITPAAAVAARRTPQSTGPAAVAAALADVRAWLDAVGTSGPVSA
jgi:argininosuccinate lyase